MTAFVGTSNRGDIISKDEGNKPSPGTYSDGKKFGEGVPTHSIRGKPNDLAGPDVPGPGTYNANLSPTKASSPSYRQGRSKRDFLNVKNDDVPYYDIKLGQGIAYTIQEKRD